MRIALAGNPNAGKSSLFNRLTQSSAPTGNYAGVTIDASARAIELSSGKKVTFVDLPGCYSLAARSEDESIAIRTLLGLGPGGPIDRVICVVDATQLARGLYLVVQLLELGIPCLIALNMVDRVTGPAQLIDIDALANRMGVPVLAVSARTGLGVDTLLATSAVSLSPPDFRPRLALPDETRGRAKDLGTLFKDRTGSALDRMGLGLWLLVSEQAAIPWLRPFFGDAETLALAQALPEETRAIIEARYRAVDDLLLGLVDLSREDTDPRTLRADRILLHPFWGLAFFLCTMMLLFQAVFLGARPLMEGVEAGVGLLGDAGAKLLPDGPLRSLWVSGILGGVGNVLSFVPQIFMLFVGLTLMEESGYLSRAALVVDRSMRRVGLTGRAFIPLMSSFACAIPGILATRTMGSRQDRLTTILIAPWMSCSARLPTYTLVTAAVFSGNRPLFGLSVGGLVVFGMYALGLIAAVVVARLLRATSLRSPPSSLVMELPAYRVPLFRNVMRRAARRAWDFVRGSGKLIVALSIVLWALLSFPHQEPPGHIIGTPRTPQETSYVLEHTIGGRVGHLLEPALRPLGLNWRIGVGLLAAFGAREVFVATLSQTYALGAGSDASPQALHQALANDRDPITHRLRFGPLEGVSLMVFFALALQCTSTTAVVRRETGSTLLAIGQLVGMNAVAYVASLGVYQGGSALGWGH